ncbi:MAG TPA: hypothetical protein VN742_09940 [Candidatus Binataceae bacterium]|nr:hypothetical protein [Candidatus Binataceae bacterium]
MQPVNWVYSVAWLSTLCLLGLCSQVAAQDRPLPIKINVDSIMATYTPQSVSTRHPFAIRQPAIKMDPRLTSKGLAPRLRMMFDYTNYRLMRSQREASACGGAVAFNLPGGHILQVAPLQEDGEGGVAMELALFEGERLIMHLPFRMTSGGALMLVDQHYPNRFYITAISVEDSLFSQGHHSARTPLAPNTPAPAMPAWIPAQ